MPHSAIGWHLPQRTEVTHFGFRQGSQGSHRSDQRAAMVREASGASDKALAEVDIVWACSAHHLKHVLTAKLRARFRLWPERRPKTLLKSMEWAIAT